MMIYKAGEFEGTLEELRDGIRGRTINLYKVPLAEITEQFIATLNKLQKAMPLEDLSSFYLAVSYLIWLKSRLLLPGIPEETDDYEIDMRDKLVDALEKLRFSKYMVLLAEYKEQHSLELNRRNMLFRLPVSAEDLFDGVSVSTLAETFYTLMRRAEQREKERLASKNNGIEIDENEVFNPYEKVTINEKYVLILEFFEDKEKVLFTQVCKDLTSRDHIVCAFFASLEVIGDKKATFEILPEQNDFYLIKKEITIDSSDVSEGDREYDLYLEKQREEEFHKDAQSEYDGEEDGK